MRIKPQHGKAKTFNVQRSTLNVQHSTFNVQHSTLNVEPPRPRPLKVESWKLNVERFGDDTGRQGQFVAGDAKNRAHLAFTLIELMVVIAIIAILAAFMVALTGSAGEGKVRSRVTTERDQLIGVIEKYHAKYGFYPQDNPDDTARSPLYYELTGTDPDPVDLPQFNVKGIANFDKNDKGQRLNFHQNLKPTGYAPIPGLPRPTYVLVVPYGGPSGSFNPWHYRSSKPKDNAETFHNPETFDLWAELVVGGKKFTIANWKE
jgi:prepilin-type N-terminal cleavage/methylation domain-containing protein